MRQRRRQRGVDHAALRKLSGTRLQLRTPRLEDAEAIYRYASDPHASRFLAWRPHRDIGESRRFIEAAIVAWQGEERLPWVILAEGKPIGMIEAKLKGRNAGIGYVLAPQAWGRGYASEALTLVTRALFTATGISAIWALCVTENPASARVLEKCGYQRDALLPHYFPCPNIDGERHDVWRYVRYLHPTQNAAKSV